MTPWRIPRGDGRVGRFRVVRDGAALSLAGYTVAWKVSNGNTPAATVIASGSGVLESDNLSALVTIPSAATATVGPFFLCVTATPPPGSPGPYTYNREVDVEEHA